MDGDRHKNQEIDPHGHDGHHDCIPINGQVHLFGATTGP